MALVLIKWWVRSRGVRVGWVAPLRLRLALLFAVATAVAVTVGVVGFIVQLRVSIDASLDPGLRTRAAAIVDELGEQPGRSRLSATDGIAQVRSLDGRLLAASPRAGDAPLLTPVQRSQALSGQVSFTTTIDGASERVLARTEPVNPYRQVVVVVATATEVSDAAVGHAQTALLLGGPPVVILAGVAAWLLAGAALAPVERMRAQAARISHRDTHQRLGVPATGDEIAALATTMNELLTRLHHALQRERDFVADAGHELRTPLAILRTELELAQRPGRSVEALGEAIGHASEETDRLIRLTEDLLLLARADTPAPFLRPQPLSLPALLAAAARAVAIPAAERDITLAVHTPPELLITADGDRLRQAIDNLVSNAIRHAPPHSSIDLSARPETIHRLDRAQSGPEVEASGAIGMVIIEVTDSGPGFPEQFLPHAFQRFHRADTARARGGGGTGLGLAIVAAITSAHGGHATAHNRAQGGATVTLRLPHNCTGIAGWSRVRVGSDSDLESTEEIPR